MTKLLVISPDLQLPLDWMSMATIVYGARGAGKTTFGSVVAEEVHKQHQRFCVIDIKGDWWGLKSSADGKRDGIPVVIFGGDHADLPLEPTAGAFIGQLVAGLEQSVIIDLEHLSKGKQIAFLTEFFLALYHHNRLPLLVLADEMQRYAPQMTRGDALDIAKCLGAVEDVVKLGRKHGLGIIGFTQRGSGLNKEVSELGDLLVAFRTPGPLDQGRIRQWLEANVTAKEGQFVMENIAGLETGTAIFASGHPDLKVFKIAAIRLRETFDSSATPRIGHRKAAPKKLAAVDIEALKTQMAATIEKQKADDPRELRKRIKDLENALRLAETKAGMEPVIKTVEKIVEHRVEVLDRKQIAAIQRAIEDWAQINHRAALRALDEVIAKVIEQFPAQLKGQIVQPAIRAGASVRSESPRPPGPQPAGLAVQARSVPLPDKAPNGHQLVPDAKLGLGERKVLAVLAQWPDGRAQKDVAFLAGYSAKASTIGVILSNLRRAALVEAGQPVRATEAGLAAAGGVAELPTGPELLEHWMRHPRIGEGERKVLRALIEAYPDALSHQELCERTNYSPDASTIGVILSKLRKLGLVESGARRVPDSFMEAIA